MLTHSKCNKCGRGWGPGGADPAIFASRAKCQTCQSKVICYAARMPRSVRFWPKQFGSGRRILSCIWAASVVRGGGVTAASVAWQFGGFPCQRNPLSAASFPWATSSNTHSPSETLDRCSWRLWPILLGYIPANTPNIREAGSQGRPLGPVLPWSLPHDLHPI